MEQNSNVTQCDIRQTSLEAVSFAIDELKATVPIWKKERYDDGSAWKENKECTWSQAAADAAPVPAVDPGLVQIQVGFTSMHSQAIQESLEMAAVDHFEFDPFLRIKVGFFTSPPRLKE